MFRGEETLSGAKSFKIVDNAERVASVNMAMANRVDREDRINQIRKKSF